MAALFLANFVRFVLYALEILIFARVLFSWIDPAARGGLARFVNQMTEPLVAPVRRMLPRTGMFDLSPMVILIAIGVILRAVG